MSPFLLLDTCAAIWISEGQPVAAQTLDALNRANAENDPVFVSPVTAWEMGFLASRGRINVQMPLDRWFSRLLAAPGVKLCEMPPSVLIAASALPGQAPRDPTDRILIATAREFGFWLVTRDRVLLDYAAQGHVRALHC